MQRHAEPCCTFFLPPYMCVRTPAPAHGKLGVKNRFAGSAGSADRPLAFFVALSRHWWLSPWLIVHRVFVSLFQGGCVYAS
jgi:hypothetical protein